MDMALREKDHAVDGRGLPYSLSGLEEKIQQALIRLTVRRGAFPLDPALGSRLYTLRLTDAEALEEQAARMIREALEPVEGMTLQSVKCAFAAADRAEIIAQLRCGEETAAVTVRL